MRNKKTHLERLWATIMLLVIVCIGVIPAVSGIDKIATPTTNKIGKVAYPTIELLDFGTPVANLELKNNTDTCGMKCSAIKEITLYKEGILIDDVRFYKIEGEKQTLTTDEVTYAFYIQQGTKWNSYTPGTKVPAGKYTIKLEGTKIPIYSYDWQIQSQGVWIEEWATWETSLSTDLKAYYAFTANSTITGTFADELLTYTIAGAGTNWTSLGKIGGGYAPDGTEGYDTGYSAYGQNSLSVNFWVNQTANWVGQGDIVSSQDSVLGKGEFSISGQNGGNNIIMNIFLLDNTNYNSGSQALTLGAWSMITAVINATNVTLYINGASVWSSTMNNFAFNKTKYWIMSDTTKTYRMENAVLDEVGFWSRQLNQTDINNLYSGGSGVTYTGLTMNEPSNNYQSTSVVRFNCSAPGTVQNVSLMINEVMNITQTGSVLNKTLAFPIGNYNWTCQTRTATNELITSPSTFFFNITSWVENSQTYSNITTESNSETFKINITYNPIFYTNILANLIYNGTSYTGIKTDSSSTGATFERTLQVPTVTSQQNISFYWSISLISDTSTVIVNSTWHNQTVNDLGGIGTCGTFKNLVLNYTMKDERTQNVINETIQNSSIEIDLQVYPLGSESVLINYSMNYSRTHNLSVCLENNLINNSQYRLFSQVKYYADEYVTRYNYLQNFSLKNTTIPQHINLFDLKSIYATQFQMSYKDATFLAVENALISINRKYVGEGVFKTVEIERTDSSGLAVAYFDLSGVQYQIVVSKNGVILSTFDNIAVFCEDQTAGNCKLSLDESSTTTPITDFYTYTGLTFTQSFNQTSRVYKVDFSTNDNSVATIRVNLTKVDGYYNTSVCGNSVTTSSGELTCSIPSSYGNFTFSANLYMNDNLLSVAIYTISGTSGKETFGGSIVMFVLGLVISMGVMFLPSAVGLVIGTMIGFGFAAVLFYITGSLITGTVFITLIVAAVLIIWRIRQGGSE